MQRDFHPRKARKLYLRFIRKSSSEGINAFSLLLSPRKIFIVIPVSAPLLRLQKRFYPPFFDEERKSALERQKKLFNCI